MPRMEGQIRRLIPSMTRKAKIVAKISRAMM